MSDFQNECLSAVQCGASYKEILEIVQRYKHFGLTQVEAYCTLDEIHQELGCDESEDNPTCEEIVEVMDRIWGFCDEADRIWEETLSDNQLREYRQGRRES